LIFLERESRLAQHLCCRDVVLALELWLTV